MITLRNKLYESLLDDEDDLVMTSDNKLIDDFIAQNYNVRGYI